MLKADHNPTLYHLPRIVHLLAEDGAEDHLDVLEEGVVTVVVAVQAYLVGVNHVIVIPYCYFLFRQTCRNAILHS